MPVKLFIAEPFSQKPYVRLLDSPQMQAAARGTVLFKSLPTDFSLRIEIVRHPEEADFVIIPQSIRHVTAETERYLDGIAALAKKANKRVIVFLTGDLAHREHIDMEGFIVFKGSEYAHARHPNEIVFAPFVEDLGEKNATLPRNKGKRPVIGFCGYAGFPSWKTRAKYIATNTFLDIAAHITRKNLMLVYKRGIYFRQKALNILKRDPRIQTNFILRDSFSGNAATAVGDPALLRQEFIDNIVSSDFVLSPKGDGNFSSRFYEALSLGRIPVLIDTDMLLPLSQHIDYSKFVLRVPYDRLEDIGTIITDFYASLSDKEFQAMQERARRAYRDHLRFDSYFNKVLPLLRDEGISAVL